MLEAAALGWGLGLQVGEHVAEPHQAAQLGFVLHGEEQLADGLQRRLIRIVGGAFTVAQGGGAAGPRG